MLEEVRAQLQDPGTRRWNGGWTGTVAGRVVVAGWLGMPLLDNLDRADLSVHVVPDERRRGYGTAMLRQLEQEARERGRTLLKGEASWPYAAGSDGTGQAGREFARRLGYALALGDVKRILRLPVPAGMLDDLAAEAAPHHAAYTLRSWAGPVPDALLDGWAALTATLETEAPTGDLEVEPERLDARGGARGRGAGRPAGATQVQHRRAGRDRRGGGVHRHRHDRPRTRPGLPVGDPGPRRTPAATGSASR